MFFKKLNNEFYENKNMFTFVNKIENGLSTIKNKIGFGYYTLNIDDSSMSSNNCEYITKYKAYNRIIIFTANDKSIIESVDALCRPGRIDKKVELTYCTEKQICDLYNYYTINSDKLDNVKLKNNITPANVAEILMKEPTINHNDFLKMIETSDTQDISTTLKNAKIKSKKKPLTNAKKKTHYYIKKLA